jgi:hypothetical protein
MTGASSFRYGVASAVFTDPIEGGRRRSCGLGGPAAVEGVGAKNDPIDRLAAPRGSFTALTDE